MLQDMIMDLVTATDNSDREKALRHLECVGVDKVTAMMIAEEFEKGCAEFETDLKLRKTVG